MPKPFEPGYFLDMDVRVFRKMVDINYSGA